MDEHAEKNLATYKVRIRYIEIYDVEVEANSEDEAFEQAKESAQDGGGTLRYNYYEAVEMVEDDEAFDD